MEDPSHVAVFGRGTVDQVTRAFQATFARVTFEGHEYSSAVTAPNLPATISGVVLGVNGLQPHLAPHKHSRKLAALPLSTTGNGPPFLPSQIAKAYNGVGVPQTGAGQTIGIVIDTFPLNSDLTAFWTASGVNQSLSNIQTIQVVTGTLPAPSGEETLDVEWSSSIAPGAKVRVYGTVDLSFTHLDQAYAQIYADLPTQTTLHQVSLSYGLGESYMSTSQMQTDEQYFAELASGGVTVFVSSGDGGSDPTSTGSAGGTTATPESPANSPSVTAVGGTSLTVDSTTGLETSESVWNNSTGATGGGVSTFFIRPNWQTGNGVPSGTTRVIPDVAAPADPNTGALVILNGTNAQYGGTSWSAPTWAGICALINQARTTGGMPSLGLLGPKIYPLIGNAAFRDITNGNNGAYSAGAGYDLCTGVGVPNIAMLLQVLANAPFITSQPATQFVANGQSASFSITVSGSTPFAYQWQREAAGSSTWTNLVDNGTYAGSATATLTIPSVTSAMSGDQFQCIVTNAQGTATSSSAPLLVGVPPPPLIVTTLAGVAGTTGSSNGTGSAALFNFPGGIALDNSGNIVVADTNNDTIRKVTPAGVVSTIAGSAGLAGSTNATGSAARFNAPSNVTVDSSGNIYVADANNNAIRKITSAGVVSTLAGRAGRTGSTNGTGTNARFNAPLGVAVDSSGNVFVADANNNLIRKITSAGAVTTFAGGGGSTLSGSTDGTGTNARFNFPVDVAVDSGGNVYVADTNNDTIREITPAGVVTTIAGAAGISGSNDGVGTGARFNSPSGVRLDAAGNVYIADTNNHTIRRLTPTGIITTLAGSAGVSGSSDGVGSAARFNSPSNALPAASGNVYVIDTNNFTLRKGTPSTVPTIQTPPANQTVVAGQSATFSVAATGNPTPSYQWQRWPAGGSTWTSLTDGVAYSGSTTATLAIVAATLAMSGDQFQCVVANIAGSVTSSPAASLTVGVAPQITSASSATFTISQAGNFTILATGTPAPSFSATGLPPWASLNANTGALTGTPPNAAGTPFTIGITASNGVAPNATQTFTLRVQTTFTVWQTLYFGANQNTSGISGPDANPSGNGIPNLLQYAIGSNPLTPAPTSPHPVVALVVDPADGKWHLTLTATLDATASGITVTGETSPDLRTWNSGTSYMEVVSDSTVGLVRTLSLRDTTSVGTTGIHYIRLRVTQP
jgi:kumamolisin